jgi:hypothetical protein
MFRARHLIWDDHAVMEGRARKPRSPRAGLAWLLPWAALGLGEEVVAANMASARWLSVAFLCGALAGVLWQVLYRRDLVDRLTFFAGLILILVAFGAIGGARVSMQNSAGETFAGLGILAALVFTERSQRALDERRSIHRMAATAAADSQG